MCSFSVMKCVFKDLKQYHMCLLKQEITEVIFQKETQKKINHNGNSEYSLTLTVFIINLLTGLKNT